MKIGTRVRILRPDWITERVDGRLSVRFDRSDNDLGTIVDIRKIKPRGHSPKYYIVELDFPNFGRLQLEGLKDLEPVK